MCRSGFLGIKTVTLRMLNFTVLLMRPRFKWIVTTMFLLRYTILTSVQAVTTHMILHLIDLEKGRSSYCPMADVGKLYLCQLRGKLCLRDTGVT